MAGDERLERHYLDVVVSAVREVAEQFGKEPASFLHESDLQSLLSSRLFDRLSRSALSWDPAGVRLPGIQGHASLTVNPVKTRYPDRKRFDVAVLSWEREAGENAWNQPVRVGLEIALWQADGAGGNFQDVQRDGRKLQGYQLAHEGGTRRFTGLSLVFSHRADDPRLDEWRRAGADLERNEAPLLHASGVSTYVVSPVARWRVRQGSAPGV